MNETPLIASVALAEDWLAAFQRVWTEIFKVVARAMGIPVDTVSVETGDAATGWKARQAACRPFIDRFLDAGHPVMVGAWAMPAADPSVLPAARSSGEWLIFGVALVGLSHEVQRRPRLIDDETSAQAVCGWRALQAHGCPAHPKDPPDPIAAARMIGATTIDRDETLQWAAAKVAKAEDLL